VTVDRAGRRVLDGQELEVRAGTVTVVRGRSGSGKTTMLRILSGLERPDKGTVTVLDTDLSALDRTGLAALRRLRIGVAGQGTALLEALDVTENLEVARQVRGLPADPERVDSWIDALGLATLRHRPVRVLSGGERQRVALARVLVVDPRVAVLDEPTSQQDEANAQRLAGVLTAAARQGTAVVAASHDPILIAAADSVVTLS
jgi:ABC-type lipoprotein export system ATPase subunit